MKYINIDILLQDCPSGSLDKLSFAELLDKSNIPDCLDETRTAFSKLDIHFWFGGREKDLHQLNGHLYIKDTKLIKDVLDKYGDLIE